MSLWYGLRPYFLIGKAEGVVRAYRIIILAAIDEIESWLEEENSSEFLINHVELPHKNVGCHMARRFHYEEQCMEICNNAPLKGLTVKLIRDEEEKRRHEERMRAEKIGRNISTKY